MSKKTPEYYVDEYIMSIVDDNKGEENPRPGYERLLPVKHNPQAIQWFRGELIGYLKTCIETKRIDSEEAFEKIRGFSTGILTPKSPFNLRIDFIVEVYHAFLRDCVGSFWNQSWRD
jgi:hypothetical protein